MCIEISELVRQNIGIRDKIKILLPVPLLHAYHVKAATILACDLMTLREMVYFLIFIQPFVQIGFAA
jgi:hypothetical protein